MGNNSVIILPGDALFIPIEKLFSDVHDHVVGFDANDTELSTSTVYLTAVESGIGSC